MTAAYGSGSRAFVVLSAVGIVYIAGTYLGLVDRVLGRGITVQATLPTSGGLFEGSEVTYRGVKVGKVSKMQATAEGRHPRPRARGRHQAAGGLADVRPQPLGRRRAVPRLRAAGRQGAVRRGRRTSCTARPKSLPVDEADLLVELDQFVSSVDKENLETVVRELGTMFDDTGAPLQRLLDNGSKFVREASAHTDETIALLDQGKKVLDHPAGGEREHPLALQRPALAHRRARRQRRRPREGPRRHARHRPRARRAAQGPRADAAGPARQRGQRQPGRGLAPRRRRAAAGDLPAHDLRRASPAPPATATATSTCSSPTTSRRAPRATSRAPTGGQPSDLDRQRDLPGPLHERPAVRHARRQLLARHARQPVAGSALPLVVRPGAPGWSEVPWTDAATRYGSSIRATCRSWEMTHGSGSWWVR